MAMVAPAGLWSKGEVVTERGLRFGGALSETVEAAVVGLERAGGLPDPEELRRMLEDEVAAGVVSGLEGIAERYTLQVVGADAYERSGKRVTRRSGRRTVKVRLAGRVLEVGYTKLRSGKSLAPVLGLLKKHGEKVGEFIRSLWLKGLSTRDISAVSAEFLGEEVSHTTVAGVAKDVRAEVLRWQNRPLDRTYRYLMLDALYVPVIRGEESSKEAVHLALGIDEAGHKEILAVLVAPDESEESWLTVLRRLKLRGLKEGDLRLVATDGHAGLLAATQRELPEVQRQRCVLHKLRNVMAAAPRSLKSAVARDASEIFRAPNRSEADARVRTFKDTWKEKLPGRVLDAFLDDMDAALAFYALPPRLWKALRTTNTLERVNEEVRRKLREVRAIKDDVAAERMTVSIAIMLNDEWAGETIEGFKPEALQRKRREK